MTTDQALVLLTIIGTAIALAGLIVGVRRQARQQAAEEAAEKEKIRTDAYAAGVQSQAYLVRQLTTERDDARQDRDVARAQADEGWRRYNDLRDRGTPT